MSFNIGRIRTKDEPRSSAWTMTGDSGRPDFVDSGRNSHIGECKRNAGCMVVYREDRVREPWFAAGINISNENVNGDKRNPDNVEGGTETAEVEANDQHDSDFLPDTRIMQKLDFDEKFRKGNFGEMSRLPSWTILASSLDYLFPRSRTSPNDSSAVSEVGEANEQDKINLDQKMEDQAAEQDDSCSDSMDYEYDSPSETCSEYDPGEQEAHISDLEMDEADLEYQNFRLSLCGSPDNHKTESTNPQEELMLPLFRPLDRANEDDASEHGSEASFECDLPPDTHQYSSAKLDHWLNGKTSCFKHPLTKSFRDGMAAWEHIAGSGCVSNRGYHGDKISTEEMLRSNTLQCLIQKKFYSWEEETGDEPWEHGSKWFLSGLSDHMPSRDICDPVFFPVRHDIGDANAENCRWNPDEDDPERPFCMPFHPFCFETYKRASLKRSNNIEIDALGSWWLLSADYETFHSFPRSAAVKRGEEQWWRHIPGDEHLAADACFVPKLQSLAADAVASDNAQSQEKTSHTRIDKLPPEIVIGILGLLETTDVARFSIALPKVHGISQPLIRARLQQQYPWLWELYDQRPYSKWTGVTSFELKGLCDKFNTMEAEIREYIVQLEKDEWHDLARDCKEYWDDELTSRRAGAMGILATEKPVVNLISDNVDIAKFALAFEEAMNTGKLKGLENRARIWKDCNTILDQIEDFKRKGKIISLGQQPDDLVSI